uniref:Small integral membrane protein 26 n=1 Tax=Poecilia formosa TaxID=48698 RepID=A0A087XWM2_POEFO
MTIKDPIKWNYRVSAVYALGVWTILGSYAFLKYTGRLDDPVVNQKFEEPENPNKHVYETAHSKTIIVYKEDFVPYSRRIYNFIKSLSGGSGAGDGDK